MLIFPSFFNAGPATYEIEQSLRFDGSSTGLTRSAFGASDNSTTWTLSLWFKRGKDLITHVTQEALVWSEPPGGTTNSGNVELFYDNRYPTRTHRVHSTWSNTTFAFTDGTQRDHSAWYHLVIKCTGTTGTNGTVVYYINGRQAHSSTVPEAYMFGNPRVPRIGSRTAGSYFSGYMAEFHYVHGTAKDATDFGEYDDNGVWRPKRYTGSYGTNGFYLKFDPSATNGIGHDHSGNGNNWSPSGFTTSGTGTDVMSDTPTNNWCTLNPVGSTAASQCSNGNLQYYNGTTSSWRSGVSSFAVSSGKWYFEAKFTNFPASSAAFVGISQDTVQWVNNVSHFGQSSAVLSYGYYSGNGRIYDSSSSFTYGASYTTNDVIGCALDLDAGTLRFYKNGVDQGQAVSGLTGTWNVGVSSLDTPAIVNFGQRDFEQTPPSGFLPLNTSNLPAPTIKDGSKNFDTKLYTANNQSAQTITGLAFSPDLLWFKPRNRSEHHYLYDQVRGAGNRISSSQTIAEITGDNSLTAFTSDGFSLGADGAGIVNYSTDSMVAWAWDAGGTGSTNTDGSITSTVSANPSAGFSIVTYTGNSTAGSTVGHGLGVAPEMIIIKQRTGTFVWRVYHKDLGNTNVIFLNLTNASVTDSAAWNNTSPTSSTITFGNSQGVNGTGSDYVAYCFAEVEGYSKFGSYVGNANADGPFVYCGFRPQWILTKSSTLSTVDSNWRITDTARSTYNVSDDLVWANLSNAELANANGFDICSNGFKIRTASNEVNSSGQTYIFAAFAEHPFGGDGVSPATAR